MPVDAALTIRCSSCGRRWEARKAVTSKPRQCPNCYSRKVEEVDGTTIEDDHMPDAQPAYNVLDEPEVRQKIRELELAKLERQIQEVKGGMTDDETISRVEAKFYFLLDQLNLDELLTDEERADIASLCPWCGRDGKKGMIQKEFFHDGSNFFGYICASCHHRVPY